jgi:hypothetical protein
MVCVVGVQQVDILTHALNQRTNMLQELEKASQSVSLSSNRQHIDCGLPFYQVLNRVHIQYSFQPSLGFTGQEKRSQWLEGSG